MSLNFYSLVSMKLAALTNPLHIVFLTTSLSTILLNFYKSTGTGFNLSTSNLSTLFFKVFNLLGTFYNLSISNLSTSDFKLAKLSFLA